MDEYTNSTLKANNTGNAWAVNEYTQTAVADTRRYEITVADFSKALLVATVPSSVTGVVEPEKVLEFTQLEQLPKDWAYLADTGGWSLWFDNVSQRGRYVAVYRRSEASGFKVYLEIRPTPKAGELYRVLYQVGDWSGNIPTDLNFAFPFPELNFYFLTLVSDSLLPISRWSADAKENDAEMKRLSYGFTKDLARYQQTFDNFVASLSVSNMVMAESYADYAGYY